MNLSPHLTLAEMVQSSTARRRGIPNDPPPQVVDRMRVLALTIFEPVRAVLQYPLHVNSGYRSPQLNSAVFGAKDSAHMRGEAIDLVPVGMDLRDAFDAIRRSNIPYDQLIYECAAWLHIGMARPGAMPRRQDMLATGAPGHWAYVPAPPLSDL